MKQWNRTDHLDRRGRAADDLLAAFIFCGWETLMPLEEAIATADFLASRDPVKAQELGGSLLRGEIMSPEMAQWVAECRAARANGQ